MKKKHRDIVVNGEKYTWSVNSDDDGEIYILIYKLEPKRKMIFDRRVNDRDSNENPVTPKYIESLIKLLNSDDFFAMKEVIKY